MLFNEKEGFELKEIIKEMQSEIAERRKKAVELIHQHLNGHNCTITAPFVFTDFIVFEITEYTGDQYTLLIKNDQIYNSDFNMIRGSQPEKTGLSPTRFDGIEIVDNVGNLAIIKLYSNKDDSINIFGDIYEKESECLKEHPGDEVLTGCGILDFNTGYSPDDSADIYEDFGNALADAVAIHKSQCNKEEKKLEIQAE